MGIPRIFDPRPNPLITGPPIYHGSIGRAPPIPGTGATNAQVSAEMKDIKKTTDDCLLI